MKKGVLLLNLGTPDAPNARAVARYLREFLSDPRVIDLPVCLRYLLVQGLIVPMRAHRSAKAYQQIWQADSPLRLHMAALTARLIETLGQEYQVAYGMRYGKPSIAAALAQLQRCQELIVLPLFPQYASASTGSAIEKVLHLLSKQFCIPTIKLIHQFYDASFFIDALAKKIAAFVENSETFLLLSYHGLPIKQLARTACQTPCDSKQTCQWIQTDKAFCYRAQCYETSRLIAAALHLPVSRYATAFQSRLGRLPWIEPYTDRILAQLYAQGVRHLVVACPAFTIDCLETLEEMGIQVRAQWEALGGESFSLVPCLNADPVWVTGLATWLTKL